MVAGHGLPGHARARARSLDGDLPEIGAPPTKVVKEPDDVSDLLMATGRDRPRRDPAGKAGNDVSFSAVPVAKVGHPRPRAYRARYASLLGALF